MGDRYFFDKRVIKKFLLKYGIMLLIAIPLMIGANVLIQKYNPNTRFILIDLAIIAVVVAVGELICFLVKKSKTNDDKKE